MPEAQPSPTAQTRFLLTSLVLLFILVLALVVILAVYPSVFALPPTETPTATRTRTSTPTQTNSPTITRTPRPTLTPSITLTPTITPTPSLTPTPTGPPTLTPAVPFMGENNFKLQFWSPDQANSLIELLNNYPNSLSSQARGADYSQYNAAFRYAVIAQTEALLRFPNALQAQSWRWGLAYNLARLGDPQASVKYADLISQVLNQDKTSLPLLAAWFNVQEPRLALFITPLNPPPGYLSSHLIEVEGQGSAFFLLLETSAAFQGYPLASEFDYNLQFPPTSAAATLTPTPLPASDYESFAVDLTGDGVDEIAIYQTNPTRFHDLSLPRVFNPAVLPPVELVFDPAAPHFEVGIQYSNLWTARSSPSGEKRLVFLTSLFPPCPVDLQRDYRWNGSVIELAQADYKVQPQPGMLPYCQYMIEHAASVWMPEGAIQVLEALLPAWPPDRKVDGSLYPLDARDELRFRLGVYQALAGEESAARQTLQDIIHSPVIPDSRWIALVSSFLAVYQAPADIYRACSGVDLCPPALVVRSLVNNLKGSDLTEVIPYLYQAGLILRASGYFDFDDDGSRDLWFTVRHAAGEKLEFWMLLPYGNQISALSLGALDSEAPVITIYDPHANPPVVLLDDEPALQVKRSPGSHQPYLTIYTLPQEFPNRFRDALNQATADLLAGADPLAIRRQLRQLQTDPGLLCRANWSCDTYYYMLGLASELARDERNAVSSYIYLWLNYTKSPFTTMARLKLKPLIVASPAVSRTITPTITISPTPNLSATATPSGFTASPTFTLPVGFIPTPTHTPAPTATAGPSPTNTPLTETPTPGTPYPEPDDTPEPTDSTPYP